MKNDKIVKTMNYLLDTFKETCKSKYTDIIHKEFMNWYFDDELCKPFTEKTLERYIFKTEVELKKVDELIYELVTDESTMDYKRGDTTCYTCGFVRIVVNNNGVYQTLEFGDAHMIEIDILDVLFGEVDTTKVDNHLLHQLLDDLICRQNYQDLIPIIAVTGLHEKYIRKLKLNKIT